VEVLESDVVDEVLDVDRVDDEEEVVLEVDEVDDVVEEVLEVEKVVEEVEVVLEVDEVENVVDEVLVVETVVDVEVLDKVVLVGVVAVLVVVLDIVLLVLLLVLVLVLVVEVNERGVENVLVVVVDAVLEVEDDVLSDVRDVADVGLVVELVDDLEELPCDDVLLLEVVAVVREVKTTMIGSATSTPVTFTAMPASTRAVCTVSDIAAATVLVFTSSSTSKGASIV